MFAANPINTNPPTDSTDMKGNATTNMPTKIGRSAAGRTHANKPRMTARPSRQPAAIQCCCHHCQPAQPLTPQAFQLVRLGRVGGYGVQPVWGDGHATGIYSFEFLRKVAEAA